MDDFPRRVGARLRELRRLRGFTLQQVEVLSNRRLKGSLLAAYERGDRNISVARLFQISTLYNLPVSELLPGEEATEAPLKAPRLAIDLVRLRALPLKQVGILADYVSDLQRQRGDFNSDVITLRTEDLDLLATAYRTTPEMFSRTLQEWGVFRSSGGGEARPEVTGATQAADHPQG